MDEKERLESEILELVGTYVERFLLSKKRELGKDRIPYTAAVFDKEEIQAMVKSSLTGWFGAGRQVNAFETKIAEFHGLKKCIMTNSGSSANLVAMSALCSHQMGDARLKPGDEVITPATTFPTTMNPILINRLVPVLLDTNLSTLNIDVSKLDEALSDKTRALFIPHILGNAVDLNPVIEFATDNNLFVIEDICDALGSLYDGKLVGTFGNMATMSFYPAHHITTGEGGGVLVKDPKIARIAKSIRDWGRACWCSTDETNPLGACRKRFDFKVGDVPYDHKYIYTNIGYNLKPMDLQGAIGLEQLKRLTQFSKIRRENHKKLRNMLVDIDGEHIYITKATENSDPNWFAFPFTVVDDNPQTTHNLILYLEKNLIMTRRMFCGNILRHDAYVNMDFDYRVVGNLNNADKVLKSTIFVGIYPGLSEDELVHVGDSINHFFNSAR